MRRIAIFFLAMVVVCLGLAILTEEWVDGDIARLLYVGAYACVLITAPAIIGARAERTPTSIITTPSRTRVTTGDEERSCITVSEPRLTGAR